MRCETEEAAGRAETERKTRDTGETSKSGETGNTRETGGTKGRDWTDVKDETSSIYIQDQQESRGDVKEK